LIKFYFRNAVVFPSGKNKMDKEVRSHVGRKKGSRGTRQPMSGMRRYIAGGVSEVRSVTAANPMFHPGPTYVLPPDRRGVIQDRSPGEAKPEGDPFSTVFQLTIFKWMGLPSGPIFLSRLASMKIWKMQYCFPPR
jgi:hypothetical protein